MTTPRCSSCATCTCSYAARGGARRPRRRRRRTSRCPRARCSRSSASPAAARRRSRARSWGSSGRSAGEVRYRGEPLRYDRRSLRSYRRDVQMVFQDPTGALNVRQTIYEAVAEGLRIQKVDARRGGAGRRGALARRPAPAGALLRPLPLRGVRRPAPARRDRRRDGARARPAGRRRAGLEPRRLGARRDPRADAAARARDRRHDPRRHPRPRARVEHRRPDRGDVPRPDRRAGHDRGAAVGPAPSVHARAAVGRAGAPSAWSRRSSPARRRTRRASPPAAASTRAARSSRPARRRGWGSRSAAAARTSGSRPSPGAAPGSAHRAACHAVADRAPSEEGGLRVSTRLTYTSGAARAGDRRGVRGRAGRGAQRAGRAAAARRRRRRRRSTGRRSSAAIPSRADRVASRAHEAPAALVAGGGRARRARRSRAGAAPPVDERCAALRRAGAAIGERHMEMAAAVTLETGKSRTESIAEVQEAIDLIEAYCEQIERHDGFEVPLGQLSPEETNAQRAAAVRRVRRDRAVQLPRRARRPAWRPARSSPATRS